MARNVGLSGDITNKKRSCDVDNSDDAARVPPEVIAEITGHRNLKTLARYDKVAILKAQAAQELLRQPYHPDSSQILTFQYHYDKVMREYHGWQLSKGISIDSDDVRPVTNTGGDFDDDPNDLVAFLDLDDFQDHEIFDQGAADGGDHSCRDRGVSTGVSRKDRSLAGRRFPSVSDIPINSHSLVTHVCGSLNRNPGFARFESDSQPVA